MSPLEAKMARLEAKVDRLLAALETTPPPAPAVVSAPPVTLASGGAFVRPDITPAELARLRRRHGPGVIKEFNRLQEGGS